MDQQKLTLDFIEKNFEEVTKKSSQENKAAKTVLPSISIVHAKAKRLIDQRIKERQAKKEALKEQRNSTNEIPRLKTSNEENNKENRNNNSEYSHRSSKISDAEDRTSHQGYPLIYKNSHIIS